MALKVYYSPLEKGEVDGQPWETYYMGSYYLGPHVAARINEKGFLIILDGSTVPEGVDKDIQLKDLGYLEPTNVLVPTTTKAYLEDMDITSDKLAIHTDQNELFKKLFYHGQCKIDVKSIKEKIAVGKSCFIGLKTTEMDF